MKKRSIFCLENPSWFNDLRRKQSVRPILEMLQSIYDNDFIYHDCAVKEEFEFYLQEWLKAKYDKFPILYLAFHGEKNSLCFEKDQKIDLKTMAESMGQRIRGHVIIFGSCHTMAGYKQHIDRFLNNGAAAVIGYKKEVNWIDSAAFEFKMLSHLLESPNFDRRSLPAVKKKIQTGLFAKLSRELGFRMNF